jgi:hypothetical protein
LQGIEDGGIAIFLWLMTTALIVLTGVTVWSRGIFLVGNRIVSSGFRLTRRLRTPWATAVLGFVLPGLGFILIGSPLRAACALWLVSPLIGSVLVMARAPWLWSWNQSAGPYGMSSNTLEALILTTVAVALLGGLAWVLQALVAARDIVNRNIGFRASEGSLIAAALLIALIALGALVDPVSLAEELDYYALALHGEGFRVTPLYLSFAAVKLDPSRPVYELHAVDLHESMGRHQTASRMRNELDERMKPYVMTLRQEEQLQAAAEHQPPVESDIQMTSDPNAQSDIVGEE